MPKLKLPRKSTAIDMTAMCDVAFLLLTFFMLATKFKPDEPVMVRTPGSISQIPLPDNSILLTVGKDGKIFFDYDNKDAKKLMIEDINTERKLGLTDEEMKQFINGSSIGCPIKDLKTYLMLPNDVKKKTAVGIPISDSVNVDVNEVAYWIYKGRQAGQSTKGAPRICIKSDADVTYPNYKKLVSTLVKSKLNSFNLLTSAEAVPEGTEAYNESILGQTRPNTQTP